MSRPRSKFPAKLIKILRKARIKKAFLRAWSRATVIEVPNHYFDVYGIVPGTNYYGRGYSAPAFEIKHPNGTVAYIRSDK